MPKPPVLDPSGLLRALVGNDVHFVVIGGVAGTLHGSTTLTADLDILFERDAANLDRLAKVLVELHAVRRDLPDGVKTPIDARALRNGTTFLLSTDLGDLDCIAETASGGFTYEQIAPTAERMRLGRELVVVVAALDELIRMKRATGRPKDRIEVETLAALLGKRKQRRRR
jgi:hypothetical protein